MPVHHNSCPIVSARADACVEAGRVPPAPPPSCRRTRRVRAAGCASRVAPWPSRETVAHEQERRSQRDSETWRLSRCRGRNLRRPPPPASTSCRCVRRRRRAVLPAGVCGGGPGALAVAPRSRSPGRAAGSREGRRGERDAVGAAARGGEEPGAERGGTHRAGGRGGRGRRGGRRGVLRRGARPSPRSVQPRGRMRGTTQGKRGTTGPGCCVSTTRASTPACGWTSCSGPSCSGYCAGTRRILGDNPVVVCFDRPLSAQRALDDACCAAETAGVHARVFCNLGPRHVVADADGKAPRATLLERLEAPVPGTTLRPVPPALHRCGRGGRGRRPGQGVPARARPLLLPGKEPRTLTFASLRKTLGAALRQRRPVRAVRPGQELQPAAPARRDGVPGGAGRVRDLGGPPAVPAAAELKAREGITPSNVKQIAPRSAEILALVLELNKPNE